MLFLFSCFIVVDQVTGTGHIDVSAHLKLLGESLTIIGARLQEHKVRFYYFTTSQLLYKYKSKPIADSVAARGATGNRAQAQAICL